MLVAGRTCWPSNHRIPVRRGHLPGLDDVGVDPMPALYAIRIRGHLGSTLLSAFPELVPQRHGVRAVLTGLLDRPVEIRKLTPARKSPESDNSRSPDGHELRPHPVSASKKEDSVLAKSVSISQSPGPTHHDDGGHTGQEKEAGPMTEDSSRAAWLQQARSYLRNADPVLARLIDDRPDFDPRAWLTQLPPMDLYGALLFQVTGPLVRSGRWMSSTSSVMMIANTPSDSASTRVGSCLCSDEALAGSSPPLASSRSSPTSTPPFDPSPHSSHSVLTSPSWAPVEPVRSGLARWEDTRVIGEPGPRGTRPPRRRDTPVSDNQFRQQGPDPADQPQGIRSQELSM
jgi:hypothetical protein